MCDLKNLFEFQCIHIFCVQILIGMWSIPKSLMVHLKSDCFSNRAYYTDDSIYSNYFTSSVLLLLCFKTWRDGTVCTLYRCEISTTRAFRESRDGDMFADRNNRNNANLLSQSPLARITALPHSIWCRLKLRWPDGELESCAQVVNFFDCIRAFRLATNAGGLFFTSYTLNEFILQFLILTSSCRYANKERVHWTREFPILYDLRLESFLNHAPYVSCYLIIIKLLKSSSKKLKILEHITPWAQPCDLFPLLSRVPTTRWVSWWHAALARRPRTSSRACPARIRAAAAALAVAPGWLPTQAFPSLTTTSCERSRWAAAVTGALVAPTGSRWGAVVFSRHRLLRRCRRRRIFCCFFTSLRFVTLSGGGRAWEWAVVKKGLLILWDLIIKRLSLSFTLHCSQIFLS